MKKMILFFIFASISVSTHAASIGSCEYLDSIGNLIGNTQSFAQGAVKIAYISTEEPATSPDHLLVFIYGDEMSMTCASVDANAQGFGFSSIDMNKLSTSYDAKKGLLISVPANVWQGEDGVFKTEIVKVRVNRSGITPKFTIE